VANLINNLTHAAIQRGEGWEGEVGAQEMLEDYAEILEQRELPGEEFGESKKASSGSQFVLKRRVVFSNPK